MGCRGTRCCGHGPSEPPLHGCPAGLLCHRAAGGASGGHRRCSPRGAEGVKAGGSCRGWRLMIDTNLGLRGFGRKSATPAAAGELPARRAGWAEGTGDGGTGKCILCVWLLCAAWAPSLPLAQPLAHVGHCLWLVARGGWPRADRDLEVACVGGGRSWKPGRDGSAEAGTLGEEGGGWCRYPVAGVKQVLRICPGRISTALLP